jgi:hypothetical protein
LLKLVVASQKEDATVARVRAKQRSALSQAAITTVTGAAEAVIRTLLLEKSLEGPSSAASALLDQRIAAGDAELRSVSLILQHYETVLSRLPPLAHNGTLPLSPSDELYACFDQFIDLLRQQDQQIAELQAILAEII